jgi:phosphatidylglycerol:prolipoprotein diacylglycerol transferase
MIPYFSPPVLWVASRHFAVFSLLLILAVSLGIGISLRRAARFKIDREFLFRMSFWAIASGLAFAHVAKMSMDYTPQFLAHPLIVFQRGGIRSLGGLIGGLAGAIVYCNLRGASFFETFRMLDVMSFALPFAWMVGRLGCFLAHDHRGHFTTSWIGVRFPEGTRYDLGLIEFLFLIGLSALFYWLDREPRPVGFFFGLFAVVYGAFRLFLDTLHSQPFRFYGGVVGCLVGLAGWWWMGRFAGNESRSGGTIEQCSSGGLK